MSNRSGTGWVKGRCCRKRSIRESKKACLSCNRRNGRQKLPVIALREEQRRTGRTRTMFTGSPARNGKKPCRNTRFDQRLARQGQGAATSLRLKGVNKRKKTRLAKEAAKDLAVARYKAGPCSYNVIDGFTLQRIAAGVAKSRDAPAETGTKSQLAAFASARRRNTERLIVSFAKNLDFDNGELVHTAETLLSVAAVAKVSATVRKRCKRVAQQPSQRKTNRQRSIEEAEERHQNQRHMAWVNMFTNAGVSFARWDDLRRALENMSFEDTRLGPKAKRRKKRSESWAARYAQCLLNPKSAEAARRRGVFLERYNGLLTAEDAETEDEWWKKTHTYFDGHGVGTTSWTDRGIVDDDDRLFEGLMDGRKVPREVRCKLCKAALKMAAGSSIPESFWNEGRRRVERRAKKSTHLPPAMASDLPARAQQGWRELWFRKVEAVKVCFAACLCTHTSTDK